MAVNLTLVLNCTEAARALGVSSGTLALYRPFNLEAWLTSKRVNGPAEG